MNELDQCHANQLNALVEERSALLASLNDLLIAATHLAEAHHILRGGLSASPSEVATSKAILKARLTITKATA